MTLKQMLFNLLLPAGPSKIAFIPIGDSDNFGKAALGAIFNLKKY